MVERKIQLDRIDFVDTTFFLKKVTPLRAHQASSNREGTSEAIDSFSVFS
jgi:hypothetical protein